MFWKKKQKVDHYFAPTMQAICEEVEFDINQKHRKIENFTVYKTENGFGIIVISR